MNNNDATYFAGLERKLSAYLREQGHSSLADFGNFPLSNFSAVQEAYKAKTITFLVPYRIKGIFTFGTKNQQIISLLIGLALLGNIVGSVVFAIINQELVFVFGALLSIAGFLLAAPSNRLLPLLVALSAAVLFVAFYKNNIGGIGLSVSFLAGIMYSRILRVIYKSAIIKRALYSETMLCYLLEKRMILPVETKIA